MSLAINDVHLPIVVHVVANDRKAGIVQLPVSVPFPLVVVGVDIFEPAVGSQNVGFAIAIDVGNADAVPVLLFPADMVHLRFSTGEINPENSRVVVVRKHEIRFAITVDVAGRSALRVIAVGNEVTLPHHPGLLRILIPPEAVRDPSRRHHIGGAVVVHVESPFSAVGDELIVNAYRSVLMALPLAAGRSRILIPVSSAQ